MAIREAMLPEFDQEMATTRKVLERIPADKLNWKPHDKSWPMGDLATHLCNLPEWVGITLKQDSLDLAPPGGEAPRAKPIESQAEILTRFDQAVMAARALLAEASCGSPGRCCARGKRCSPCRVSPCCAALCSITSFIIAGN
jgi:hypothetical protein